MTIAPFLPLIPFATIMSITPGPNNLMVASSGVNFGFRRTIPHMLGVTIGFPVLIFAIGLGLGHVFVAFPKLQVLLKFLGGGYLLWIALKLVRSRSIDDGPVLAKPVNFIEAALFQWINPKAWLMGIALMTTYGAMISSDRFALSTICLIMLVFTLWSIATWTAFGSLIAARLHDPKTLRIFNISMAAALVLSLIPMMR